MSSVYSSRPNESDVRYSRDAFVRGPGNFKRHTDAEWTYRRGQKTTGSRGEGKIERDQEREESTRNKREESKAKQQREEENLGFE